MLRVLVTGGSGFIGGALAHGLNEVAVVRVSTRRAASIAKFECAHVGELGAQTDWRRALEGVDVVVHAAGLAHGRHSGARLKRVNVDGAEQLATQAQAAGVRRFILISSIKAARALGVDERSGGAYGSSKLAGERAVLAHAALSAVVLRPPLVFAAAARANCAALMRMSHTPLPLPFASLINRRSLISLRTLVAAVRSVLHLPSGPSGVFHVADRPALSTPEIVTALRAGWGRGPGLFRAPTIAALAPRALKESLLVDDAAFRTAYGYGERADVDVRDSLRRCAAEWAAKQ